jgi:hypothetical protein
MLRSFKGGCEGEISREEQIGLAKSAEEPDHENDRQRNAEQPQKKTASHLDTLPVGIAGRAVN